MQTFPMHLAWIMSLRNLVKLQILIQNLFHLNCGLQIRQIWIHLITECGEYSKRRCSIYSSLIWTNWNSDWEPSGPRLVMSSLRQPFVSGVVDRSRLMMRVVHLFLQHFPHSVINCIQILWFWRPRLRWNKLWSFFINSVVARMRWAPSFYKVV